MICYHFHINNILTLALFSSRTVLNLDALSQLSNSPVMSPSLLCEVFCILLLNVPGDFALSLLTVAFAVLAFFFAPWLLVRCWCWYLIPKGSVNFGCLHLQTNVPNIQQHYNILISDAYHL